jgi:gamma-glutamyltranspeptidase/glutathione hydrolase
MLHRSLMLAATFLALPAMMLPALVLPASADAPAQPEDTIAIGESRTATAERFMVAAAHPAAVAVGHEVLEAGGNAIDAMVAVQIMLNLVEPQSSGIGGGSFLLYWDAAAGQLLAVDGRETAPAAAGPDLFLDPATAEPMGFWDAVAGGRSVGVPGTLLLLEQLHERHGTRPWAELLAPTIELAETGFAVSPRLAGAIADAVERGLDRFEPTRDYFFDAAGAPLAEGAVLANPAFAETLRAIAEEGSAPFYQGAIGEAIVAAVTGAAGNPGGMSMADLASYEVVLREPACASYREHAICGMGPPSSGGIAVGQILGLLEHVDMAGHGSSPTGVHLFLEASKLAYADRALYVADEDFVSVPTAGLLDSLYLMLRAQAIDHRAAMPPARAGNPPWQRAGQLAPQTGDTSNGTSHVSIVDEAGNIVSLTSSIETGFGSRLMAGGFLLNNELTDFSFRPEVDGVPVANRVEPGKRPRSSMAPTIVFDAEGQPVLVVGSPGGARIINYVAKTIVAMLDWGLAADAAVAMGHFSNLNGDTALEAGSDAALHAGALEKLGHTVTLVDLNSGLHVIERTPEGWRGAADPRREGTVMGK